MFLINKKLIRTELLRKIYKTNSDSLSNFMMDVQTKSNVLDACNWMTNIKYRLISIAGLKILVIFMKILFYFKVDFDIYCPRIEPKNKRETPRSGPRITHATIKRNSTVCNIATRRIKTSRSLEPFFQTEKRLFLERTITTEKLRKPNIKKSHKFRY